jgi:hypothetical protein
VSCTSGSVCEAATITCPADEACSITCDGNGACRNMDLFCADGTCALGCLNGPNVCRDVVLNCGSKNSIATCMYAENITAVELEGSVCACEPC